MLQRRQAPASPEILKVNVQENLIMVARIKQAELKKEKRLFLEWWICKDSKKASEIYDQYLEQVRKNNAAGYRRE